jgi:hypothetical protein
VLTIRVSLSVIIDGEMSINKFGLSLGASNNSYYQWNALLRNYVRDNTLCRTASGFDARSRKIQRVARPEADNDAVNKVYVDTSIKQMRDQQEEIEKKIATLRIMLDEIKKMLRNTTTESAKDS